MKKIFLFLFTLLCVVAVNAQSDSVAQSFEEDAVPFAEQKPEYPGGEEGLLNSIKKELVYPKKAIKEKIEGTVRVTFIVEKNGSISNIKTMGNHIGGGLDEEAMRVIGLIKNFKPATQNGKPVRFKMVVPIKFKLN